MIDPEIRKLFPGTRELVYLNAAAQSLLPLPVAESMREAAERHLNRGITGYPADMACVEKTRAVAARKISATGEEIAFIANTAEGVGKVAESLDWNAGDEVLVADIEYPANVFPWAAQAKRGVRLEIVPSHEGRVEPSAYLERIGPRTRGLAVSHVQYSSGHRIDLEPLGRACRERGILFFVDAIQSLGVLPIDVKSLGIGALAVDGRKWLMGPTGRGFLFVAREWAERMLPSAVGAWSVQNPEDVAQHEAWIDADGQIDITSRFREAALRFEAGYPNVTATAGLGAALELAESLGAEAIEEHVGSLVEHTVKRIEAAGFSVHGPRNASDRAGIVTFTVPGSPVAVFRRLNAEGISLACRGGRLRIAPHIYNVREEIDRAVERIEAIVGHH